MGKTIPQKILFKSLIKSVSLVLVLSILAGIFFWQYNQNKKVTLHYFDQKGSKHTLVIPLRDKERLLELMQKLFAENSFAYTLLGKKPISWETYRKPLPFLGFSHLLPFSDHHQTLRKGWSTWEKYQHLFPSTRLWAECPKCHPDSVSILIVNEEQFNLVVNNNKVDFEMVLGRKIVDGFQLLEEAKNCSLMNDVLRGHQALIGMVLGYGRDNSWQFHAGCENRRSIGCVWGEENPSIEESADEDISLTDYYLHHYSCPSFAGNPNSDESRALKEEYLLTQQKVIEYYKGKDFLEATLSLLAGHS